MAQLYLLVLSVTFVKKIKLINKLNLYWQDIVGPEYVDCSYPYKATPIARNSTHKNSGILIVHVAREFKTYMEYQRDTILININTYMGFKAFHTIRFMGKHFQETPLSVPANHHYFAKPKFGKNARVSDAPQYSKKSMTKQQNDDDPLACALKQYEDFIKLNPNAS